MRNNLPVCLGRRAVKFFILHFSFLIALLCLPQGGSASGRADDIVAKLAAGFRAMKGYEVTFRISAGDNTIFGSYAVQDEEYYLRVGEVEVFGDGKTRYEVDNGRCEVAILDVDTASRNILNNPVRAFDFLGSDYKAALKWERDGEAAVMLTPLSKEAMALGVATVTVSTDRMRPLSLAYDFDGEHVKVLISNITPLRTPFKSFSKSAFLGYELIDFR